MRGAAEGGVEGPGAGLAPQPVEGVESIPLPLLAAVGNLRPVQHRHRDEEQLAPLVLVLFLPWLLPPDGGLVLVPGQGQGGQGGGQGGEGDGHAWADGVDGEAGEAGGAGGRRLKDKSPHQDQDRIRSEGSQD